MVTVVHCSQILIDWEECCEKSGGIYSTHSLEYRVKRTIKDANHGTNDDAQVEAGKLLQPDILQHSPLQTVQ